MTAAQPTNDARGPGDLSGMGIDLSAVRVLPTIHAQPPHNGWSRVTVAATPRRKGIVIHTGVTLLVIGISVERRPTPPTSRRRSCLTSVPPRVHATGRAERPVGPRTASAL